MLINNGWTEQMISSVPSLRNPVDNFADIFFEKNLFDMNIGQKDVKHLGKRRKAEVRKM